jgi:hypothetical protein
LKILSVNEPTVFDTSDGYFEIGSLNASNGMSNLPHELALSSPYPNPFNSIVTIEYAVPKNQDVVLRIFDVLGRQVETLIDEKCQPGYYRISWRADRVASGLYFLRMSSGDFVSVRKLHLLK